MKPTHGCVVYLEQAKEGVMEGREVYLVPLPEGEPLPVFASIPPERNPFHRSGNPRGRLGRVLQSVFSPDGQYLLMPADKAGDWEDYLIPLYRTQAYVEADRSLVGMELYVVDLQKRTISHLDTGDSPKGWERVMPRVYRRDISPRDWVEKAYGEGYTGQPMV